MPRGRRSHRRNAPAQAVRARATAAPARPWRRIRRSASPAAASRDGAAGLRAMRAIMRSVSRYIRIQRRSIQSFTVHSHAPSALRTAARRDRVALAGRDQRQMRVLRLPVAQRRAQRAPAQIVGERRPGAHREHARLGARRGEAGAVARREHVRIVLAPAASARPRGSRHRRARGRSVRTRAAAPHRSSPARHRRRSSCRLPARRASSVTARTLRCSCSAMLRSAKMRRKAARTRALWLARISSAVTSANEKPLPASAVQPRAQRQHQLDAAGTAADHRDPARSVRTAAGGAQRLELGEERADRLDGDRVLGAPSIADSAGVMPTSTDRMS